LRKQKKSNFITELSLTFLSQIIITISQIILLQILAKQISEEGLGIYLIIRRLIAFAFPVVTLNLSDSMSRYISFDKNKAVSYFKYSFLILGAICLGLLILVTLLKDLISVWLFGDSKFSILLFPTILFLFSNSCQVLCIGYFRGKQNFRVMNLVNIVFWIVAIFALLILYIFPDDYVEFLFHYFLAYSIAAFIINGIFIGGDKHFQSQITKPFFNKLGSKVLNKKFFNYGISRIPNNFFFGAVFFIPIIFASNSFSLKMAAYIGVIISIVRILQLIGLPFNMLFVPKFSAFQAQSNDEIIRKHSQLVLEFILTLPFWIGIFFSLFARELVLMWFGEKYEIIIPHLQWLGPISGFLIGFVLIRGVLDGFSDYPYINIITLLAVGMVLALSLLAKFLSWNLTGLTLSFGAGLLVLGISSIYILVTRQNLNLWTFKNVSAIIWFVIGLTIAFGFNKYVLISSIYYSLVVKILLSVMLIVFSFVLFRGLKFQWIDEFLHRIR
jgi:O-antigen/teichoic acid export membrane protein